MSSITFCLSYVFWNLVQIWYLQNISVQTIYLQVLNKYIELVTTKLDNTDLSLYRLWLTSKALQ